MTLHKVYYPAGHHVPEHGYTLLIGAFDGIHQGHLTLYRQACTYTDPIAVLTFDPPPKAYFHQTQAFQTLQDKYEIFIGRGISALYVIHFDASIAQVSAEDFITSYLNRIPIRRIVVGQDFRFGYQQNGDTGMLQQYRACDIIHRSGSKISSSLIRQNPYVHSQDLVVGPPTHHRSEAYVSAW